jgi:hypothetical protein
MIKPDLVGGLACCAAILFSFGAAARATTFFNHPFEQARMPNRPAGSAVASFPISVPDKEQL